MADDTARQVHNWDNSKILIVYCRNHLMAAWEVGCLIIYFLSSAYIKNDEYHTPTEETIVIVTGYRFLARQIVHVYVPAKCQSISRLKFILWVIAVSTWVTALFRCVCSLDLSGRVGGFWKTKHYMDCSSSRPSKSHYFRKQWSWLKFHTNQHIWHWRDRSFLFKINTEQNMAVKPPTAAC